MASLTTNVSLTKPANGENVDAWDVPVNADWDIIDAVFGNTTTINVVGASGTVALTAGQYRPRMITFSGLLTASPTYQIPTGVGGQWSILNSSTGAFTITLSSAGGGTTVTLPQGKRTFVQCDGTNVITGTAASGANSDITSLSGLSTPLSLAQGGTGAASAAAARSALSVAGLTDANSFSNTQTLTGSSSVLAEILTNAAEIATVSATAATGTIAYYIASQSVLYFTSSAAANWTLNLTLSAGTTLNSAMATGQSVTAAFLVTQGSPAYYNTAVQVDGTTTGVTTKWLNGSPTAGTASGVDVYSYVIIKTGSATFTVFASRAAFS